MSYLVLMKTIILNSLLVLAIGLALLLTTRIFQMTHPNYHDNTALFLYGEGNAEGEERAELLEQLAYFNDGYLLRDTTILEVYMDRLFSRENILILGTMPGEIFSGYEGAADLVSSDWLYWGDVNMLVESANISAHDSVAWFSMIGNVEFDFTSLLDLPLRVTGLMVLEEEDWKFQQLQFQFDLNTSWVLYVIVLLTLLLLLSLIRLVVILFRPGRS